MEDRQGRTIYICRYCEFKDRLQTRSVDRLKEHILNCMARYEYLIYGVDYIVCALCNLHCQKLGTHLTRYHKNISLDEYKKQYGIIICSNSSKKYSKSNLNKLSWQSIAIANGEDLTEFYKQCGEKISERIMHNPEERERRSKLMSKMWNDGIIGTPEMLEKMAEASRQTSMRPEIIAQRVANLAKWRKENPDLFQAIIQQLIKNIPTSPTWFSKPEKMLFAHLQTLPGFNFQFNQVIKNECFDWPSHRKQIDMADKIKNIYVEYDGPYHFNLWNNVDKLNEIKRRDQLLNEYIIDQQFILVRISYDQFHDSHKHPYFIEGCLEIATQIIMDNKPGVYKIGKKYE